MGIKGVDLSMKKLRLLFTDYCNNNCEWCCNNDWDINKIPFCESYKDYDEILITGGEPLLFPNLLIDLITEIKKENNKAIIYLYTALPEKKDIICGLLSYYLDGICITLHNQKDAEFFNKNYQWFSIYPNKSLRLNVFKGININKEYYSWKIKKDIEWIKDCPLPEGEILMKYKKYTEKLFKK